MNQPALRLRLPRAAFVLSAALCCCACTTSEERAAAAEAARAAHYKACLDERRTNAVAWERIEAECREEAEAAAKPNLESPSTPLSVISIPGGR
ncbi:MAG: hypothetical protein AAFX08_10515 [Pseudomonadota bacterium]